MWGWGPTAIETVDKAEEMTGNEQCLHELAVPEDVVLTEGLDFHMPSWLSTMMPSTC